jgi:hypothetical protein
MRAVSVLAAKTQARFMPSSRGGRRPTWRSRSRRAPNGPWIANFTRDRLVHALVGLEPDEQLATIPLSEALDRPASVLESALRDIRRYADV